MGQGNLTPSFEEVNYSLLNVTSDPGKVMEQILPAIPAKHLKDGTGTTIRDLTPHLMDPTTWNGKKNGKNGCRDEGRTFTAAKPSTWSPMASVEPD